MIVKMLYQCFINGQFIDVDDGKIYDIINLIDGFVSNYLVCVVIIGYGFLVYIQLLNRQF